MSIQLKSNSYKTAFNHSLFSEIRFHDGLWDFFHHSEIEERLVAWLDAAKGDRFRLPVEWEMKQNELYVYFPPLPKGYIPISEIHTQPIEENEKIQLLVELCDALSILHKNDFILGFILPESIYFHPENGSILIDIQPFPTSFPFVNKLTDVYSYQFLSTYSRSYSMARISDYYAVGLLLEWLFPTIPTHIESIFHQLIHTPNMYLFAEEIAADLRKSLNMSAQSPLIGMEPTPNWLHPAPLPISGENHKVLSSFLRSDEFRFIGLICEDETILYDIYSQSFNEVLEHNIFFRLICKDRAFATLRDLISNTTRVVLKYSPDSHTLLRTLNRKFDQLLKRHFEGNDIFYSLTDWLFHFFKEVTPKLPLQELYYAFEKCEDFDNDSQLILQSFWKQYHQDIPGLHFFFSGKTLPIELTESLQSILNLDEKKPDIYENLLSYQLGRAHPSLLFELSDWLNQKEVNYSNCSMILEELIQKEQLIFNQNYWNSSPSLLLDWDSLSPEKIIANRLKELENEDLELLNVLACLPMPISIRSLFIANHMDLKILPTFLRKLSKLGLLFVCNDECMFVPKEVVTQIQLLLSEEEQRAFYQKALTLQYHHQPNVLPPLIVLAQKAKMERVEYYLLLRYYRPINAFLTYEKRKSLLERIKVLHQKLNRRPSIWLDRMICRLNQWLNQFAPAAELASSVFHRTGRQADRIEWLLILMNRNEIDLLSTRKEMFEMLESDHHLDDKVRAAYFISWSNFYIPLQREEAERVLNFYILNAYFNRSSITPRYFCELTIVICLIIFKYFPEKEEWGVSLLEKTESILETSFHQDLKLRLYDAYSFQSNMKLVFKYIHLGIEGSKRRGFTLKEQVGHLNGMEVSLYQGDLASYHYHNEQVVAVDEIKRKDLAEGYILHHLLLACEWERWDLFEEENTHLSSQPVTTTNQSLWEVYKRYAAYRKKEPLPDPIHLEIENEESLFLNALYEAEKGFVESACRLFQASIDKNQAGMIAGWSYREILNLQFKYKQNEIAYWLGEFKTYLKKFSYDVFWPDYYRFSALWAKMNGDLKNTLLFARRSVNGYQLIDKKRWQDFMSEKLEETIAPEIMQTMTDIKDPLIVDSLLHDRQYWLQQALELQVIILLSEQITEKLELSETVHRLSQALFDYFPVSQIVVTFNLSHHKEKKFFSNSGLVDNTELLYYQSTDNQMMKKEYSLYQQGNQSVFMDVYIKDTDPIKLQHMDHFLSFIKPHFGNALLYREMVVDDLTGYYLKRYFIEKIKEELEISKRYGLDLSLIMIDIDDFRKVNEFGHQEGDRVLQEVAEIIQSNLRKNDIPGRYGGEEILLILPKTDGQAALQVAHKIREQIEQEFSVGRPYTVTVSVGVSSLELCKVETVEDLISYADNAEIQAKTTGKNKVVASWMF
ncbi:GGDEF domain-containing protein [Neobacillus sp. D3-1R]|uniref:GGDEF domain-containing protein n=1 Tax=Neobacillus sp. D3-1R TaxID=3445778 RepID=UPI003FA13CF9